MTSEVVTRWYRPPELLFDAESYGAAVDIFSLGAVFCELTRRTPCMPGSNDMNQLELIASTLGTPTETNWPRVTHLSGYCIPNPDKIVPEIVVEDLWKNERFASISTVGLRLLHRMMRLDPNKRVTAERALDSMWFREEPLPTKPVDLPRI